MSLNPSFGQSESASDPTAAFQALLIVSPGGQIQFATARANLWMKPFTAASPLDRLPEALTRWLQDAISGGSSSKFIVDHSGRRLSFRLLLREENSICLSVEEYSRLRPSEGRSALTGREQEVLHWVARGKTNTEIGEIMTLRTRTIGKYLEHVFKKLGVENRTAAASFDLGTNYQN